VIAEKKGCTRYPRAQRICMINCCRSCSRSSFLEGGRVAVKLDVFWEEFDRHTDEGDRTRALHTARKIIELQQQQGKSHSKWNWKNVCSLCGISPHGLATWNQTGEMDAKEENAAEANADRIVETYTRMITVLGPIDIGKETKRYFFVYPILEACILSVRELKNRATIRLEIEDEVVGIDSRGPVEFVIKDDNFTLVIVEVKKDDLEQGRAQLIMQMRCAHGYQGGFAYGFVTTGYHWIPIMADESGTFFEADPIILNPKKPTRDGVKELLKAVHCSLYLAVPRG